MQSVWEEAHSVALREGVEKGLSFAEIAASLNSRFGTAYTRNAAIGRARRLGLSVPKPQASASPFPTPKKPDARRICAKRVRHLPGHEPVLRPKPSTSERAAALSLRCVAITPR